MFLVKSRRRAWYLQPSVFIQLAWTISETELKPELDLPRCERTRKPAKVRIAYSAKVGFRSEILEVRVGDNPGEIWMVEDIEHFCAELNP